MNTQCFIFIIWNLSRTQMLTSNAHKTPVCIKYRTQCNIIYASFRTRCRLIDECAMLNNQRHQIFCDCLLLLLLFFSSDSRVRVPHYRSGCSNWIEWNEFFYRISQFVLFLVYLLGIYLSHWKLYIILYVAGSFLFDRSLRMHHTMKN